MSFVSDELANVLKSVYMMEEGSKKDDDEDSSSKVEKKNGDVPKEKRRKHKHKKHSKSKSKDKKKHKKRKHKSRSRSRSVSHSRSRSRSNEREDTLKKSKRRSRSLSSRSKSRSKSPATPEEIEHDFVLEKEKTPEMADDNGAKAGTQENNLNATDGTVGVAKAGSEGKLDKQEICESKVLDDNAQEFYASSVQNASSDKNESCINSVPTTTKEERDRSRSRSRSDDEVNNLKRKKSASKSRSRSKSVDTKTSKSIKKRDSRSGSKDRKTKQRSRSKSSSKESLRKKKSRSRSRSRRRSESRSKERRRKKSHSKSRSRSRSNSSRSRSRSRKRSMSRSRKRSRSRSHRRSKSRSPRRRRSRSRSRKRSPVFRKNFRRFSPRWRRGGGTFRRRWSRSRSRSRSPRRRSSTTRRRSRSRSRGRSRRSRSGSREKRQKRSRSKSRSTSRDRRRSQSRSRSKSKEKTQPANTLPATGVTAVTNKVSSVLDKPVATDLTSQQAKVAQRAGGKTIAELTAFCKKLQEDKQIANSNDNTDTGANTEEDDSQPVAHHPFLVKEKPDITIPAVIFPVNKPPLPTVDPNKPLQEQFPVSCGSKHREKEGFNDAAVVVADVDGSAVQPKVEVFAPPPAEKFDISELVAKRMESQRRLQSDPNDVEALLTLQEIQMKMQNWCQSNVKPGQFTGELVKNLLPKENLQGGYQAWAKKDMFHNLMPVSGGIGMKLLQKMGWKPGQVIGKRGEGYAEPIALTVKIDRKGLSAGKEKATKKGGAPALLDLQGKHPVSALAEYCSKRKWGLPDYTLVFDHGPAHHKQFLFKVLVNSVEYQPAVVCGNKKQAKAQAAIYALKGLGLIPEDAVISAI